jgi:peroxiredoxin
MAVAGLVVVVASVVSYLVAVFVFHWFTYRTWLFDVAVIAGSVIAVIGWATGQAGWIAVLAMVVSASWFIVSRAELQLRGSAKLSLSRGAYLPPLALRTVDGAVVTDQDLIRQAPVLLVLYRGWWCPSSKLQLGELLDGYDRLAAAGVSVYAASVDSPEQAAPMQAYLGGRITILCGMPVAVLEAIGARDTRGAPWYDRVLFGAAKQDVAMPTTILVDTDGRVAASHRADTVDDQPHPRTWLQRALHELRQPGTA